MIKFLRGTKYTLAEEWRWKLSDEFTILKPIVNAVERYELTEDGWIIGYVGFGYDGPSWYPDVDWMMEPSCGHDILHFLIADGCIPESQNNLIDKELENIALARSPVRFGWKTWYRIKARVVRRATNLVHQRIGDKRRITVISKRGKHYEEINPGIFTA